MLMIPGPEPMLQGMAEPTLEHRMGNDDQQAEGVAKRMSWLHSHPGSVTGITLALPARAHLSWRTVPGSVALLTPSRSGVPASRGE
jgi:hypothetical protein